MRLEITAPAENDLARIFEFNLTRSLHWAERVETRLLERCELLLSTPMIGRRITLVRTRRLSVPDIQYVIDYRVDADLIQVLRFQSTRELREPS